MNLEEYKSQNHRKPQRGDIYYITSIQSRGSEQSGNRPAIIVSNNMNNTNSDIYEVVYLTTRPKSNIPTHASVNSARMPSTALCEQISTVAAEKLENYIATCTDDEMAAVEKCMKISLELNDVRFGTYDNETLKRAKEHISNIEALCRLLEEKVKLLSEAEQNFKVTIGEEKINSSISLEQMKEIKKIALSNIYESISEYEQMVLEKISGR